MCFDVFYEVFGKHFVWFSLGFYVFEVFCPVWALYNIKRGWDTPPGPTGLLHKEALVPLPRLVALYRVPLCQTGTQWQRIVVMFQDCLAHLFVVHCRPRIQETSNFIADSFLAHLFVLHCPVQAETTCLGKLGGGCSVEQSVSI